MGLNHITSRIDTLVGKLSAREEYLWEEINTALFEGLRMIPRDIVKVLSALPKRHKEDVYTWDEINTALMGMGYSVPRIMKVLSALKWK